MTKISQLSSIGDSLAVGDQFLIRDIDDTGTPNKSVTVSGITRALDLGTAAAPAIAFASDKNTGIYSPGADQLAISTGGSGRLFVDASGNIGLGITPVANTLLGGARGSSLPGLIELAGNGNTVGASGFAIGQDGSGVATLFQRANTAMYFATNGTERLRITSTGDLNFKGAGTAGSTQAVSFNGSAPVDSMVLTSGGLLGIGTSSPSTRLEVASSISTVPADEDFTTTVGYFNNTYNNGTNGTTAYTVLRLRRDGVSGVSYGNSADFGIARYEAVGSSSRSRLDIRLGHGLTNTTDTTVMTLLSSGAVGIGTTGPDSALHIVSTSAGADSNHLILANASSTAGTTASLYFAPNQTGRIRAAAIKGINMAGGGGGNPTDLAFFTNADGGSPTEKVRIDTSGRLLVGTVTGNANGGILQLTSGITFPATAVAASDANTLDDYEEGTWTPAYTGFTTNSGTLTAVATYVKIGTTVMYQWQQTGGNISTSAGAYITGMPFLFGVQGLTYGGGAASDSGTQSSIVAFYQGGAAQFATFMTAMNNMTGLSWSGITRLTP